MAKAPRGLEIGPKLSRDDGRVLTRDAQAFLMELQRAFTANLGASADAATDIVSLRPETAAIRDGGWKIAALPRDLADLRTGMVTPLSRKELLGGLNSGARLCLADFCDFTPPAWDNLMDGHINLMDRWTSAMEHVDAATGKRVSLSQRLAALMLRVRPLSLAEPRVKVDGAPIAAGLFDAGLYLFHNAKTALAKASGPYLCLPGIASQAQARAWNDILIHAQSLLGLPLGAVWVNVLIDRMAAVFDLDAIIYELRDHMAGVSMGGERLAIAAAPAAFAQKGRALMEPHALDAALSGYVIRTAHRRSCLVLAALARQNPKAAAEQAVRAGFDGLWTAHPDHVAVAAKIFNDDMPTANQIYVSRDDASVPPTDIGTTDGGCSEDHFRRNIRVALAGFEAWLSGRGPLLLDGGIVDATCAEFRRLQLWQWIRQGARLGGGRKASEALYEDCVLEALNTLKAERGEEAYRGGHFREAAVLLRSLVLSKTFEPDFLPLAMKKLA